MTVLTVLLFVAAAFAAWAWLRPYSWSRDPGARCDVIGVQLREDHGYYWVEPHIKIKDGEALDLTKPILLVTGSGRNYETYGTTFACTGKETDEAWLKFWVEKRDVAGGLRLKINDGTLELKSNQGMPSIGSLKYGYFTSAKW